MKNKPRSRWHNSSKVFARVVAEFGEKDEVASLMGVSPSFVDSILRGAKPVPPWHAANLAQASRVEFSDFVDAHLEDVESTYMTDVTKK